MVYYFFITIIVLLISYIIYIKTKSRKLTSFNLNKNSLLANFKIQKNGFNNIDHVYILNLSKNLKRKENIISICNLNNIYVNEDNIFSGVDGNSITNSKNNLIKNNFIHNHFKYYFPIKPLYFNIWRSLGCLGHYISFYRIFQNAIYNNLEYFMIIEDDSIFNKNINQFNYIKIMKENNCDFLSLGQSTNFYNNNNALLSSSKYVHSYGNYKFFNIADSIGLFQQTHTIIFKTSGISKIIKNYFPMKCPTDVMLGNFSRDFKTDICNNIIYQSSLSKKLLNGLFIYPSLSKQNTRYSSDIDNSLI